MPASETERRSDDDLHRVADRLFETEKALLSNTLLSRERIPPHSDLRILQPGRIRS
jgi:hypothetical protein